MISTHILNTSRGTPAGGVPVKLQKRNDKGWVDLVDGTTNSDGRFNFDCEKTAGIYQIIFEVEKYLKKESQDYFYQNIPVVFKIEDTTKKYHVPLLLNPFGYSTYRGS
jgi:5-hydroxyisourate hydrolase